MGAALGVTDAERMVTQAVPSGARLADAGRYLANARMARAASHCADHCSVKANELDVGTARSNTQMEPARPMVRVLSCRRGARLICNVSPTTMKTMTDLIVREYGIGADTVIA